MVALRPTKHPIQVSLLALEVHHLVIRPFFPLELRTLHLLCLHSEHLSSYESHRSIWRMTVLLRDLPFCSLSHSYYQPQLLGCLLVYIFEALTPRTSLAQMIFNLLHHIQGLCLLLLCNKPYSMHDSALTQLCPIYLA